MWGKKKTEQNVKQTTSGSSSYVQTSTVTSSSNQTTKRVVTVTKQTTSSSFQSSQVTHQEFGNRLPTITAQKINTIWDISSLPSSTTRPSLQTDARPFTPSSGTTSVLRPVETGYQSPFNRRLPSYGSARGPAVPSYQSPYNRRFTEYMPLESRALPLPSPLTNSTVSLPAAVPAITSQQRDDDNLTYNTKGTRRGKALIINNIKFLEQKEERKGAEKDEQNLKELLRKIGFEVATFTNLKKSDMHDKIKKFRADRALSKSDISLVVIMSHGHNIKDNFAVRGGYTQIIGTDGKGLEIEDVLNEFTGDSCPQMKGKPKIFIFQCCRGDQIEVPHTDAVPINVVKNYADMLIGHSTLPGFVSLRDPKQGSWYIQSICKVFKKYAKDWDIETMLKMVDQELSTKHPDYRQTSSYESRGFNKRCFLNPVNPL